MGTRDPKYRRQKRRGRPDLAFVELDGQRVYLGTFGTAESRREYHRNLAEWHAGGHHRPVEPAELSIAEIIERFWEHAEAYYRHADGTPTNEIENFKPPLRDLKELYGETSAAQFSPRALKALRVRMVARGQARTTVNKRVDMIKRLFRWGVAEELVPPEVSQALQAVAGLRRGRSQARESEPVGPVKQTHVDAVEPHVSRQVWCLIQLQLLTAARPGELVVMRGADLDTSGRVWLYRPATHKTAHHGHARTIYLGPKAQAVLKPFLAGGTPWRYVFSPAEAEEERRERRHTERVTPMSCGNVPGSNRKASPEREPGECYTVPSYRRAIHRACKAAGVPQWSPHRLRHSSATALRKRYGLDTARVILGHTCPQITDMYAELDAEKAIDAIAEIG